MHDQKGLKIPIFFATVNLRELF